MRSRFAWLAAAAGLAGAVAYRARRRRSRAGPGVEDTLDPRAEELRRKLAEARDLTNEREEFESAETPVDRAEPAEGDVGGRREELHARARQTADRMRRSSEEAG